MNLKLLAEPFPADQIEWRLAQCGQKQDGSFWAKALAYVANRPVMDRLDDVCGPQSWNVSYFVLGGKDSISPGIIATISIKVGDEWVAKSDGAEQTDIESFKGGLSSAMKRAAVQWGIGRYLYDLEEGWAETTANRVAGWKMGKTKDGKTFYWRPPTLPDWALPGYKNKIDGANKAVAMQQTAKNAPAPAITPRATPQPRPITEIDTGGFFDEPGANG